MRNFERLGVCLGPNAAASAPLVAAGAGGSARLEHSLDSMTASASGARMELTLGQRVVSASVGAVLTSLLVTPLDVVKTRLHAQVQQVECIEARSAAECPRCTHFSLHNGLIDVMLPKTTNPHAFGCPQHFTGTADALYKIAKYEGVGSLYNGLRPSLIMAVPSTVLYFASYDKLRNWMQDKYGLGNVAAPLLAGTSARTLAATAIAPLELVRTKIQAMNNPPPLMRIARTQVRSDGVLSLWRGLAPTLMRDVPFSAVYWVCVERCKEHVRPLVMSWSLGRPVRGGSTAALTGVPRHAAQPRPSSLEEFAVSFIAGATGGMVAATLTNPFDVVKTRRQVFDYAVDLPDNARRQAGSLDIMRRIWLKEGLQGFFLGLTPRLGKIMPACAIMLSSYEGGKSLFLTNKLD